MSRYVLAGYGSGTLTRLASPQPEAYLVAIERFDPRHSFARGHPARVLVQHGRQDDVIRRDEALALHAAAGPDAEWAEYDCGHSVDSPAARADRLSFMTR